MASEAIIEMEGLLGPISEDNPVGEDIREDSSGTSSYNLIKDARSAARSAERKNMFEAGNSEADDKWREVMELATDILQNQAKDLDVASAEFKYDDEVLLHIVARSQEVDTGARNIENILAHTMLPEMASECLSRMANDEDINQIHVSVNDEGKFSYQLE